MKKFLLVCILSLLSCSIFAASRSREDINRDYQHYSQEESRLQQLADKYYASREDNTELVLEKLETIKESLDSIAVIKEKLESEAQQLANSNTPSPQTVSSSSSTYEREGWWSRNWITVIVWIVIGWVIVSILRYISNRSQSNPVIVSSDSAPSQQTPSSPQPAYALTQERRRLQGVGSPIQNGNLDGRIDFDA